MGFLLQNTIFLFFYKSFGLKLNFFFWDLMVFSSVLLSVFSTGNKVMKVLQMVPRRPDLTNQHDKIFFFFFLLNFFLKFSIKERKKEVKNARELVKAYFFFLV